MMIAEIENLLQNYRNWLEDKTTLKQVDKQWVEITTPYLDHHNDCLQIYVRKENGQYILTDDGYIVNDLINSGCSLDSPKRQDLLKTTLNGFGVKIENGQLTVNSTMENFALKKHNIIQAMLSVHDLFYVSSPHIASLFLEDVANWLDISNIRFTPKIKFTGKSGYDYVFNFVIPKSRNQPERIVQALTNPQKEPAKSLIYNWIDTKETRNNNSKLYAFLNDSDKPVPFDVIAAFENYDLTPVPWSKRDELREMLAS